MFLDSPNRTEANLFKQQMKKIHRTTVLSLSNRLMAMILFLNPLLLPAGVGKCFNVICLNLEEEKKKNADWNDFSFRLPKFEIL